MVTENVRKLFTLPVMATLLFTAANFAAAQDQLPRTEWGHPDLQGVWNFSSNTPMQRDARYGNREFLSAEEIQALEARLAQRDGASDAAIPNGGVNEAYNDFWVESRGIADTVRTSIIIYPENGRLPPFAEGAEIVYGRLAPDVEGERPVRQITGGIGSDGPEDRALSERCILGFNAGPPFTPSLYNNNLQIIQNRDHVAIIMEMVHESRIIPLDDRPPLDENIGLWLGDSRGYWDGDTLVVETRNFNGMTQTFSPAGTSDNKFLTERFTRVDANTIDYEFTIEDDTAYTDRITGVFPITKIDGQIYEYACHEGNYGMVNILRGARAEEARAEAGTSD